MDLSSKTQAEDFTYNENAHEITFIDPKKHWEYRAFLVDFIQNARFKFVYNAQDTSSQYLIPQKMPVIISKKRKIHSFTGADKQLEPYVD